MVAAFFKTVIDWYMLHINYASIALLMGVESTVIPFPSEIIVPPAAWKAAHGELNIYGVIAAASVGALLGSLFNYFFALILGRPILYKLAATRWARLIMINEDHLLKAEKYFVKHGKVSTFIGRLVPGIRHLISIPAGIARMSLKQFCLFTFIGSSIWNVILAMLGIFLYNQKDQLEQYYHYISYVLLGSGILFVLYLIYKYFRNKSNAKPTISLEARSKEMVNQGKITD